VQISAEGGTRPVPGPESDEAILAEIEEQFGMYEARQLRDIDLQHELGLTLETPGYEEVVTSVTTPLLGTRHMSLAMPVENTRRQAPAAPAQPPSASDLAPPDYHVGSGFNTYSARDRAGSPRTTTEYYVLGSRRPRTRPAWPLGVVVLAL